jgi:DNA-binding response OmpR family regulator
MEDEHMEKIILFMENKIDFLAVHSELLERAGYKVLKAPTLEEAEEALSEKRIHLAIMDIRMLDDDDEHDISGLLLAQKDEYRHVPKIILTAFPSYEYVREALGPASDGLPPAVGFIHKPEGPQALIQAVEQAFVRHVRINGELTIRWGWQDEVPSPYIVSLISHHLPKERLADWTGEFEDLLRKLFYEKQQVAIGRILWHREGRVCMTSFVHSIEGAWEQFVVVCGLKSQIEQTIDRCKEFASIGGLTGAAAPSAKTLRFAAVAYALPEADLEQVQPFEAFYRTNKIREIKKALECLFEDSLSPWHQGRRILERKRNLCQLYCERLNLCGDEMSWETLKETIKTLASEALSLGPAVVELTEYELTVRFPNGDTDSYPNPIHNIRDGAEVNGAPVVCRITPGTLAGDNILVDQNGRTWLTDFAQTGHSPLLWDFSSIEATIRFDLVRSTDVQALHEFERRLLTPARLNERLDVQDMDHQFRKALGVIQEVRRQASPTPGADAASYYRGVFFHALSRVANFFPDIRYTRFELARPVHALLSAAMISGEDHSSAKGGIEIDTASQQVWVEGRAVKLSPLEFDLFLYLHDQAGHLCERRAIVEQALKDTYIGDDQEASRINTLIGRLRSKIEPDPDQPRYIVTVRGKGYRLDLGRTHPA